MHRCCNTEFDRAYNKKRMCGMGRESMLLRKFDISRKSVTKLEIALKFDKSRKSET